MYLIKNWTMWVVRQAVYNGFRFAVLEIRKVSSWQSRHDIRFVSPVVGILKFQMNPLSLGAEVEIRLPGPRKTIFLGNTSVLGIRALNNVRTWVTYWKR